MSTLNVKIPDEMEDELEAFLDDHPGYLNRSELVRDAIRHLLAEPQLSRRTLEDDRISRDQIDSGEVVALDEL